MVSAQPGLDRKETEGGRVCFSGRKAVCIQGGAPLLHTSVTLVK